MARVTGKRHVGLRGAAGAAVELLERRVLLAVSRDFAFQGASVYSSGSPPQAMIVADVDNDGRPDIITAQCFVNALSIQCNEGEGVFAQPVSYMVGADPVAIAAGDLNGDGYVDLVTADSGSDTVSVLLNNGDGTFSTATSYAVGAQATSVIVVDLNHDGKLDLVTANQSSTSVMSVFLNNGDGTFGTAVQYNGADLVSGEYATSVAAADFDSDGNTDLAVSTFSTTDRAFLFQNNGDGAFEYKTSVTSGSLVKCIAAGDTNGDGRPDLVTAKWVMGSATVSVMRNLGNWTFADPVAYFIGEYACAVDIADVTGDGRPDIIAMNDPSGGGAVSILQGDGAGGFATYAEYGVGSDPFAMAIADMTRDGSPDIVVARHAFTGDIAILENNGNGTFQGQPLLRAASPNSVAVADFNGDGEVDLATANSVSDTISIIANHGNELYGEQVQYPAGPYPSSVTAADLDRDGTIDVAAAIEQTREVRIYRNLGGALFQVGASYDVGSPGPFSIGAADLNNDGYPDLVTANNWAWSGTTISVLINNGDGTFGHYVTYDVGYMPKAVAFADFDGDGWTDIAVADAGSNDVSVLRNLHDGTFAAAAHHAVGTGPSGIVAADLNGDGRTDLATANAGAYPDYTGSVSVLLNDGNGGFAVAAGYAVDANASCIVAADLNGDGATDLAAGSEENNGTVCVLRNLGAGTYPDSVSFAVGSCVRSIATADFNNDGRPDLAVDNGGDGTVSLLLNTLTTNFVPVVSVQTPLGPQCGNISFPYTLTDVESERCVVRAEYSLDGDTWHTATPAEGSDAASSLASCATGSAYRFVWDSAADLGDTGRFGVRMRLSPSDGTVGTPGTTQLFTVDHAPTATAVLDKSSPSTNDTLTATATKSDVDGDSVSLTFVWKVNGVVKRTYTTATALADNFDLSLSGNGDHGDMITVEVTPNDGMADGTTASSSALIVNSAPVVTNTIVRPIDGYGAFAASVFASVFSDPDPGDSIKTIRITSLPAHGCLTLAGVAVVANQEIPLDEVGGLLDTTSEAGLESFTWNGSDGSLYAQSDARVDLVPDQAPTATVFLSPHAPLTDGVLTATATKSDANSDPVNLTFVWTVNGVVVRTFASGTVVSDTLSLKDVTIGLGSDAVTVEVIPNDGIVDGASVSDAATVANIAPTAAFSAQGSVALGMGAVVTFFDARDCAADLQAGLVYSYDLDDDGVFEIRKSSSSFWTIPPADLTTIGVHTVRGRVMDQWGAHSDYSTALVVNPPSRYDFQFRGLAWAYTGVGSNMSFSQTVQQQSIQVDGVTVLGTHVTSTYGDGTVEVGDSYVSPNDHLYHASSRQTPTGNTWSETYGTPMPPLGLDNGTGSVSWKDVPISESWNYPQTNRSASAQDLYSGTANIIGLQSVILSSGLYFPQVLAAQWHKTTTIHMVHSDGTSVDITSDATSTRYFAKGLGLVKDVTTQSYQYHYSNGSSTSARYSNYMELSAVPDWAQFLVVDGTVLRVSGTQSDDTITLSTTARTLTCYRNGVPQTVPLAGIQGVVINGLGGNDVLDASVLTVPVTINGGGGNDTITGGAGADSINGGSENDVIYGGLGADTLLGGSGSDVIFGNGGADSIVGGKGLDSLYGAAGADTMLGGAAADVIYGQGGTDSLDGGSGDDSIYGAAGADTLVGGTGNDLIYAGGGDNEVHVSDGPVIVYHDIVYTGTGVNRVEHDLADTIFGDYVELLG